MEKEQNKEEGYVKGLERRKRKDEVGNLCLQITITDETTLAIGQQNLTKANQLSRP